MGKVIYAVIFDNDVDPDAFEFIRICNGREELDYFLKSAVDDGEIDADDGYSVYELKRRGAIKVETKVTVGWVRNDW